MFTHSGEEDVFTLRLPLQRAVLIFCGKDAERPFFKVPLEAESASGLGFVRKNPYSGNVEGLSQLQIVFVQFTSHNKFMFHC